MTISSDAHILPYRANWMIRAATHHDIPHLAPLFGKYRKFYDQSSSTEEEVMFLDQRLSRAESTILVACDATALVGFCQLYPTFSSVRLSKALILNDLFVDEAARKSGCARALLEGASSYAAEVGAKILTLETSCDNLRAQKIYIANGWKRSDEFVAFEKCVIHERTA